MRWSFITSLVAVTSFFFLQSALAQNSTCVTDYAPGTDYFPGGYKTDPFVLPITEVIVQSAQLFNVYYNKSYKLVRDNSANTLYLLYQCGTPKPDVSLPSSTPVKPMAVPLKSVALDSTVPAPYLQLMGLTYLIQRADLSYGMSPCLQLLKSQGKILPFDGNNMTNGALQAASIDGVISAYSLTTSALPANYITFSYSAADNGPLQRAEWIKYLGTFFNAEPQATQIFSAIANNYNCLSAAYTSYPSKKTIVWATFTSNTWVLYDSAYKLKYNTDAGGKNLISTLLRTYNMSMASDVDALRGALTQVDVLIDETYVFDLASYNISTFQKNIQYNPALSTFPFINNLAVYRVDRRVGPPPNYAYDWYEMALVEPQVVLSEIAAALHPEVTTTPKYIRNLAKGEPIQVVSQFECSDPLAAPAVAVLPCPSLYAAAGSPPPKSASAKTQLWSFSMTVIVFIVTIIAF